MKIGYLEQMYGGVGTEFLFRGQQTLQDSSNFTGSNRENLIKDLVLENMRFHWTSKRLGKR